MRWMMAVTFPNTTACIRARADALPSLGLSFPVHAGLRRAPLRRGRSGLTAYEHRADGEDLLGVGVGTHVAKAYAGKAA